MSRPLLSKNSFLSTRVGKFTAAAVLILSLAGLTAGFGVSRVFHARERAEAASPRVEAVAQPEPLRATAPATKSGYLRRDRMQPRLREALVVFGDRLERAGKERLVVGGTLTIAGKGTASRVHMTRELADRMHLEERSGSQRRSLHYDRGRVSKAGGDSGVTDEALLETLVNDSAEHFFEGQFKGLGTRFLGFRFRLDDGADDAYAGPFYDVYQVADRVVGVGDDAGERVKLYYFNSDTRLLERVRYQIERGGVPTDVEVLLGDWQRVQGQMIPKLITRVEGGATVFTLGVESVGFAPRAADGSFTAAESR